MYVLLNVWLCFSQNVTFSWVPRGTSRLPPISDFHINMVAFFEVFFWLCFGKEFVCFFFVLMRLGGVQGVHVLVIVCKKKHFVPPQENGHFY